VTAAPPGVEDVRAAAARIAGHAHRTPVLRSSRIDDELGARVVFKCENLQRVGAFKFRGALNALSRFTPAQRRAGVVTYSSGNHAQAVALAARILEIPATIVMPHDAPATKVAATLGYGAEVIRYDRFTEDREALGAALAAERGLTLVPPYDDPAIIAGQGTVALELLDEVPELGVIAAPVGGGGLISGTSIAARGTRPGIAIVGVETEAASHAFLSLKAGERVQIPPPETIADGIRTAQLGTLTWPIIQRMVDEVVLVSEDEVKAAMRFLLLRLKLVVEPTGALTAAAALTGKLRRYGSRAGLILSGGNAAPDVLRMVLD